MENNIILNYTLEKYNKKYRNRRHRLLKYTKKQVDDFDKQYGFCILNNKTYNLEFTHYLLKDRKWALIDDTYYEIPKPVRVTWFRNLSVEVQAIACIVGVTGVTSAVIFPTLSVTVWNKGGGDTPFYNYCTVTFDTDGGTEIPSQKVKLNELVVEPTNPIKEPDLEYNYHIFKEWQLDGAKFAFSTPITHNITLKAKYDSVCWYSDTAYVDGLKETDIGLIRGVTVNNQLHKVRLIGIDHDKDIYGNTLHTTWEFANIISDSDGYSLAYQWDDRSDVSGANRDYPNSSIRKVLCGSGNWDLANHNIYCATKASSHYPEESKSNNNWDANYTYTSTNNKTILSMLPDKLRSVLKTVKKTVRINSGYTEAADCSDKLFMLSCAEMNVSKTKDEGAAYNYYKNTTKNERIKQQIKGSDGALTYLTKITNKVTLYQNVINCRAGFNSLGKGGYYFLRSPDSENVYDAWGCSDTGAINSFVVVYAAFGVAPAFCL